MRFSRTSKALGMVAIAALALTGCGAGGGTSNGAEPGCRRPQQGHHRLQQRTAEPPDARQHRRSLRRPRRRAPLRGPHQLRPQRQVGQRPGRVHRIPGRPELHHQGQDGHQVHQRRGSHRQELRRRLELCRAEHQRAGQQQLLRVRRGLRRRQRHHDAEGSGRQGNRRPRPHRPDPLRPGPEGRHHH